MRESIKFVMYRVSERILCRAYDDDQVNERRNSTLNIIAIMFHWEIKSMQVRHCEPDLHLLFTRASKFWATIYSNSAFEHAHQRVHQSFIQNI